MRDSLVRMLFGVFLLLLGGILLLGSLQVIQLDQFLVIRGINVVWLAIFGLAGLGFLAVFLANTRQWWAVIPGMTLIGLAALVGNVFTGVVEEMGGAFFMFMIALSFLLIFLVRREQWWSLIPGGVLLTITAVIALTTLFKDKIPMGGGSIFFIGIGLTFLAVYFVRADGERMKWAIYPAAACGAVGLAVLIGFSPLFNFVWPVILILLGIYILWRASRKSQMG
ncbi:MAG TPA: hypothetical protein VIO61_17685 [Anaerolineaceae bacterium]